MARPGRRPGRTSRGWRESGYARPVAWVIVGVDCGAREDRLGLARGLLHADGRLEVTRVTLGTAGESPARTIANWLAGSERHLIALDSPLGWPAALGGELSTHRAGQALAGEADRLFRRQTDDFVHAVSGKRPPPVGADAIARMSHAALGVLAEAREASGLPLPLAWAQGEDSGAIEVYPAASLAARKLPSSGYRAKSARARALRGELLERVLEELDTNIHRDVLIENPDLFGAMLSLLSGADFVRRQCQPPPDPALAAEEGWIWVRVYGQARLL